MTTPPPPTHLGDGAYVSLNQTGSIVLTANHHDPNQATDVVVLGEQELVELMKWIDQLSEYVISLKESFRDR